MADNKASFLWAVKQQESGGNYSVKNPSSGALGAYQVMPENVGPWTQQALGRKLTPAQFLANPSAQDSVANAILGGYYDQFGASGAAAMWYSGQPDPNKTYGNPSVKEYVNQVMGRMTSTSPVEGTPANSISDALGGGLGDVLGSGLEQGLITAFKSIMGPVFKWTFWLLETGIGFVAIIGGAFLIAQKSDVIRTIEGVIAKTAAPEAAPAIETVEKKVSEPEPVQTQPVKTAVPKKSTSDYQKFRATERRRMEDKELTARSIALRKKYRNE